MIFINLIAPWTRHFLWIEHYTLFFLKIVGVLPKIAIQMNYFTFSGDLFLQSFTYHRQRPPSTSFFKTSRHFLTDKMPLFTQRHTNLSSTLGSKGNHSIDLNKNYLSISSHKNSLLHNIIASLRLDSKTSFFVTSLHFVK